jgi:hypothetical protein
MNSREYFNYIDFDEIIWWVDVSSYFFIILNKLFGISFSIFVFLFSIFGVI